MTKTVCDICGKEMPIERFTTPIKDMKFCISSNGRIWDVCNKCRDALNEWMKERKAESEVEKIELF